MARFEATVQEARDARESIVGSFDVLIARTGHRTNDIMKILTLTSVILLPGTLIAGVMGMNFKVGLFAHTSLFWVVVALIIAVAPLTLGLANVRAVAPADVPPAAHGFDWRVALGSESVLAMLAKPSAVVTPFVVMIIEWLVLKRGMGLALGATTGLLGRAAIAAMSACSAGAAPTPSPFAKSLLFGYVAQFVYEGDSPIAERRAAALAVEG